MIFNNNFNSLKVGQVSLCFSKAFRKPSSNMTNSTVSLDQMDSDMVNSKSVRTFVFEAGMEVKEDDGRVGVVFASS